MNRDGLNHRLPLAGFEVEVSLPRNLTDAEAERIIAWLRSLVAPWAASPSETAAETTPADVALRCRTHCDSEFPQPFKNGWDAACEYVASRLSFAPLPPAATPARPGRCSVCGSARIRHDDGTYGACTLVPGRDGKGGCPAPLRDFDAEQARRVPAPADPGETTREEPK